MSDNQPIQQPKDDRNFFEKWIDGIAAGFGAGVSSVTTGVPKSFAAGQVEKQVAQTQAAAGIKDTGLAKQAGQTASEAIAKGEEKSSGWLLYPYRQYVARPLSTAFLSANAERQNQLGTGFFDVETWKKNWEDARHVSPGQSIVGFVGADLVNGTQGTDKLDWSNAEEVRSYFNHGPQRWISFGADFATMAFLDPYILAGKGAGAARRTYGTVPVTTKNMPTILSDIDKATIGGQTNSWSVVTDFLKTNANDKTAVLAHPIVKGNNELADVLMSAAKRANETGNDGIIGDALKVAIGDSASIDKALYDSTFLADEIGILSKKKVAIEEQLKNPSSPPMGSRQGLLNVQRRSAVSKISQRLDEANSDLTVIDKISSQSPGTIQQQTVSRFGRIEKARANSAMRFSESYWTQDVGPGARVTHYLEPSTMLREKPAGFAEVGGIAGDRSYLEFAARLRQWAKINNKPMSLAKKYFDIYTANLDKTARHQMLIAFDEKAMRDTVITNMKSALGRAASPEEAKLITEFADMIAKNSSRFHKQPLLQRIVDENYTIVDDTGSTVYLKHLADYEKRAAKEIAANRAGAGTKPTASDIAEAKRIVKDSLSGIIPKTSQLPNVHYGVNLERFNDIVAEHATQFASLLKDIEHNPRLQNLNIKTLFDEFSKAKSSELLSSERVPATAKEKFRTSYDFGVDVLDSFYNSIWKPITLASLHYTSRNVFEGWQRVLAVALETSRDTGMSATSILRDALEPSGGLVKKLKEARARKGYNKEVKTDAKTAQNVLNTARKDLANDEYKYGADLADALYASSDSVHSSLLESLDIAEKIVQNYSRPTVVATQLQKDVVENMQTMLYRIGDESNLPVGVNKELFNALVDLDHTRTFEILSSVDEPYVLRTLGELQSRITKQRAFIEKTIANKEYANLPFGMQEGLSIVNARLNNIEISLGSTAIASIAKASVRGKLENLISKTDILHNMEKSAQGNFEVIDGLHVPDAFADVLGEIMRGETSAIKNSTAAIFNLDRVTTNEILHGRVKNGIIKPFVVDEKTGIKTTNTNWAEVAADHANRQYRDASIQKLMRGDVTAKEHIDSVIKWAKSKDPEAVRWRELMKVSIGLLQEQGFKNPIREIVERNAFFVESHTPEIGIDGRVVSPLKDANGNFLLDANGDYIPSLRTKALNGELTAKDMLEIPEAQRTSTFGSVATEIEAGNITSQIARIWKSGTQWMFKHIGSNPETYLVRHPFYTMMYRTEMRRLANLMKSQGRSLDYIDGRVSDMSIAAHKFAYKNTMEKLYSIERKTDPGTTMRFLSPFYMAKQNSNRFWFGYYMRNPQAFTRYFQLYSSPTRIFDVEDNSGKDVTYVNPFASAGASIMITIPESVAKYLKIPGGSRTRIPISSFDLINNGTIPFAPEIGGPVFTYSAGHLLNAASGKPYDPELFLTKLGIKPSLLTQTILPFYKPDKESSARDSWLNAIFDTNSWMDSVLRASSTGKAISIVPNLLTGDAAKDQFNSRLVKNYIILQQDWMGEQDKFVQMKPEEQAKHLADMLSQAASYTVNEYLLEAFISGGPTIGSAKIEDKAIRFGKELRQYQKQYGQEEGRLRYTQFLASTSDTDTAQRNIFAGEFKSREVNMFGVLSTPQTVYNISQNKSLWGIVETLSTGKDNISDSKILGALFNGGDPLTDYTQVANEKLYKLGIKKNITDPKKLAKEAMIESGNAMYINYLNYYRAEGEAKGIPYRSPAFNAMYADKLKQAKEQIGNINPMWKLDQKFSTVKALQHITIINTVINDKKFINSVGKSNPIIPGLVEYMEKRKPLVKQRLAYSNSSNVDIYSSGSYGSVVMQKEQMAKQVIEKYPEFKDFYDYYLSNDPLLPALGHKE